MTQRASIIFNKLCDEHLLSKILYKFRYRKDREFYEIETNDFVQFISTIEVMNKLYDTKEKLIDFIEYFYNKYYKNDLEKRNCMFVQFKTDNNWLQQK